MLSTLLMQNRFDILGIDGFELVRQFDGGEGTLSAIKPLQLDLPTKEDVRLERP